MFSSRPELATRGLRASNVLLQLSLVLPDVFQEVSASAADLWPLLPDVSSQDQVPLSECIFLLRFCPSEEEPHVQSLAPIKVLVGEPRLHVGLDRSSAGACWSVFLLTRRSAPNHP